MTWSYEIRGVNHYFWSYHKEWIWILLLLHAYYSSKQLCIHIHVPVCINKGKIYGSLKACWTALYSDISNKRILWRIVLHEYECIFRSWNFLRLLLHVAQDKIILNSFTPWVYQSSFIISITHFHFPCETAVWKLIFAWILFYKVIDVHRRFKDKDWNA